MQRLLWILLAAIALLLVILVSNGNAPLFGLPSDSIAETAYLGMWGVVIAAGLLGSGIRPCGRIDSGIGLRIPRRNPV